MTTQELDQAKAQAFSQRMLGMLNEAALALMTAIGHQTGLFDAMADYLDSTFDWYVAPRELAEQIRDRALKPRATAATDSGFPRSTLEAINPSTGEFDISRYTQAEGEAGGGSQGNRSTGDFAKC